MNHDISNAILFYDPSVLSCKIHLEIIHVMTDSGDQGSTVPQRLILCESISIKVNPSVGIREVCLFRFLLLPHTHRDALLRQGYTKEISVI